ncbi:MAG TPA: ferritin-like domain-containing protein [Polyangiaceae bacterium]|nr:ferritin-like domain-containing protein [Polyangiaceae bacterium]
MRRFRSVDARLGWIFAVLGVVGPACGGSSDDGRAGGSAGSANAFPCQDPKPLMVDGKDTGVDTCAGGIVRRREAMTCPTAPPATATCTASQMDCSSGADCTDQPNGYCNFWPGGGGAPSTCSCAYGCTMDSECAAGQRCLCGDPVGKCVAAECDTSADCGTGFDCISPIGDCKPSGLVCQTAKDECGGNTECGGGMYCGKGTEGNLVCKPDGCAGLGRPFLVEGAARLAEAQAHDGYLAACLPRLEGLSPSERDALGAHWTAVGLMEHASIAAFARFTLQLLGLGAPAALVQQSGDAQVDETRHAEIAFSLASAFAGKAVGPGVLDLSGALLPMDRKQVLADVIREGCIGETLAAVEAEHAAAHAADPTLSRVLAGIAADESRHAELAWRFVAWMLKESPQLAPFVRDQFARALLEMRPGVDEHSAPPAPRALALGIVEGAERAALRLDVLERVVRPSVAALTAVPPTPKASAGERVATVC